MSDSLETEQVTVNCVYKCRGVYTCIYVYNNTEGKIELASLKEQERAYVRVCREERKGEMM